MSELWKPGFVWLQRWGRYFCSRICSDTYHKRPVFCEACLSQTVAVSSGDNHTFNGFGTGFYGGSDECPHCGSVIRRQFVCFFFIPIIPTGRFRVKRCGFSSFYSRRMRRPGEVGASLDLEDEGHELLAAAIKLEVDGRIQDASAAYQYIAQKYPQTSAGNDAQKSLESLRALTGRDFFDK